MRGTCLCGEISFEITAPPGEVVACHCGQCRKQSGHYWASADVALADIVITGSPKWFRSSDKAQRGFCGICGSFLFWKADGRDGLSFGMGAIDGTTGARLVRHIFTADKGDYYQIGDGAVQE